ncbi:MAG: zinc-binding dehydrogenase, partial [Gammaproteobacteria bacterium]
SVLVVGAGPIGLAVVQSLLLVGGRPAVTDVNPDRLAFCAQAFPQIQGLAAGEALPELLRDRFSGDLPTLVFDCTGSRSAMMRSFSLVAPGGKLVFVGLFIGEVSFDDPEFHKREMTLLGSRNATARDFRAVIEGMESGRIAAQSWVTHRTSSDQLIDAFPAWLRQPALRKAMIEW